MHKEDGAQFQHPGRTSYTRFSVSHRRVDHRRNARTPKSWLKHEITHDLYYQLKKIEIKKPLKNLNLDFFQTNFSALVYTTEPCWNVRLDAGEHESQRSPVMPGFRQLHWPVTWSHAVNVVELSNDVIVSDPTNEQSHTVTMVTMTSVWHHHSCRHRFITLLL